jgi:DNA-binding XRE family transcriptional regulator
MKRLRDLMAARVRAGKTQKDCAKVLGITSVTYAQKERGFYGFSLDQAGTLAAYLQIPKEDFFKVFLADNVYTNNNTEVTA